jgi:hypothetical protein
MREILTILVLIYDLGGVVNDTQPQSFGCTHLQNSTKAEDAGSGIIKGSKIQG